ncbi:hypothetical protein EDB86DRAFT_2877916 [Lactarius hatsudake]|nr:hypothetical protein EDB86DRAFT_2877916 [Lactarius hatsudake]
MASGHRPPPPPSPQPPSAPTSIPTPSVASSYLSVGHAQDYGRHPLTTSPGTTSSPLLPQYEYSPPQHPSAYPLASQYISEPGRPHPAFPTHQVQTHVPPTHTDLPSRTHRSVTMPIPELHNNTHVAPGLHPGYALQAPSITHSQSHHGMLEAHHIPVDRHRNQYDSHHVGDRDYHDNSAMHSSGIITLGPPSRPVGGAQDNSNSSSNSSSNGSSNKHSSRARIRGGNQPQNQTVTPAPSGGPPPPDKQPATFLCRLAGCQAIITDDVARRWSGYCCASHRDMDTNPNQHPRR